MRVYDNDNFLIVFVEEYFFSGVIFLSFILVSKFLIFFLCNEGWNN